MFSSAVIMIQDDLKFNCIVIEIAIEKYCLIIIVVLIA